MTCLRKVIVANYGSEVRVTKGHAATVGDDCSSGGIASASMRTRGGFMTRPWTAGLFALAATAVPLTDVPARMTTPQTQLNRPVYPGRANVSGVSGRHFVVVRCESFRLRQIACPVASHANVKVAHVLGGRCITGLTWFYDRHAIHVRGGCRAVFIVGGAAQTPVQPR